MGDLEFRRVQDDPPLYDLYIGGELAGNRLTLDEVIARISAPEDEP